MTETPNTNNGDTLPSASADDAGYVADMQFDPEQHITMALWHIDAAVRRRPAIVADTPRGHPLSDTDSGGGVIWDEILAIVEREREVYQ